MSSIEKSKTWISSRKYYIITITLLLLLQAILVIYGLRGATFLDQTMVMYLSSTSAQVIAALFGITITGYIFFNSRLLSTKNDETLFDAVEALRNKYFKWLILLSTICITSIIVNLVNFLINNDQEIAYGLWNRVIIAEGIYLTVLSLAFITLFILSVVNPRQIENISNKELDRLNKGKTVDSSDAYLSTFLRMYNEIDKRVAKLAEEYNEKNGTQYSMMKNLEALMQSQSISYDFINQMNELRKYRNYLVHGNEMVVSTDMYSSAQRILTNLRSIMRD